jgi:hypothetical protein
MHCGLLAACEHGHMRPLVSDPVGVTPPVGRIVAWGQTFSRRRGHCPLRIMDISSMRLRMIRAQRKSLKPCINSNGDDKMVRERPIRGFDFARTEADDQNPVALRYEFEGLWK